MSAAGGGAIVTDHRHETVVVLREPLLVHLLVVVVMVVAVVVVRWRTRVVRCRVVATGTQAHVWRSTVELLQQSKNPLASESRPTWHGLVRIAVPHVVVVVRTGVG